MVQLKLPAFPTSKMFTNLENQTMSREWLNFLLTLYTRVGGQSATLPDIGPLTANRITATDADTDLGSVTDLTDWIAGTTYQVIVTDNGDGTLTLSLPQSIDPLSSVTFAGVITAGIGISGQFYQEGIFRLIENTPAQITANQNNYNPGSYAALRLSSDAPRDITGIVPSGSNQGRVLFIFNVGANNIVLKHQDANSTAANRIIANTGADITLSANEIGFLWYDDTTNRWRATEL